LIVNPRGLAKPVSLEPSRDEGTWTALYGSVTFNQYGREFPCGGMNERGLVVEVLWLNGTTYPPVDDRRALGSVQWLQYQLDTAATVDEVLASLQKIRIYGGASVHFYLADSTGAAAALEFLSGKAVVHRTGESMPAPVLANHTYAESAEFLASCQGWGGDRPLERSSRSLVRFARAALGARELAAPASPPRTAEIFGLLDKVAQGGHTQWSIVHDLKRLRIRFRTSTNPDESLVDLSELDFSCGRAVQWLDLSRTRSGNVRGQWVDYDARRNRELIVSSYRKTEFLRETPKGSLDRLAAHPDRARCLP
jgi:choloylglycine hydrolase